MSGPNTAEMPYVAPVKPNSCGRFSGDAEKPIMVKTPTATPEPPTPAIARPTIRVVGFLATPQTRLPTSKTTSATKYQSFKGKYRYSFPQVDWNPVTVSHYLWSWCLEPGLSDKEVDYSLREVSSCLQQVSHYTADSPPPNVMKYAAPYQDTLFKSWNSSVIFGMAVPRIVYELERIVSLLHTL